MTNTFCTIITPDYYPYALTLYKSIRSFQPDSSLQVLVVGQDSQWPDGIEQVPGLAFHTINDLGSGGMAGKLVQKYQHTETDNLRWSLKPVFIHHLLKNGFKKVLFTDCDIFFYTPFGFLFDELDTHRFLLTPHWFCKDPLVNEEEFKVMLIKGCFNAGFIGANTNALPILDWWANACFYRMGIDSRAGVYDDQRYLDIVPVRFDGVKVLQHKGCNLAAGFYDECPRTKSGNQVLIDGHYPIVFIHFTPVLISTIIRGHDPLLSEYWEKYRSVFEESGKTIGDFKDEIRTDINAGPLQRIGWKWRIRTRLKNGLYRLSQKL